MYENVVCLYVEFDVGGPLLKNANDGKLVGTFTVANTSLTIL
jgi:hypothetical protein